MTERSTHQKQIQKQIYDEAIAHYSACEVSRSNLSDTWTHTLKEKGSLYTIDEMLHMLAPGNKVNSWVDDLYFLVDHTLLDTKDPIIAKLLAIGEHDFGSPNQELLIGGKRFSSGFLQHVVSAAHIIREIEKREITSPRVMEIGGGLGGLAYLLRSYFGEKLTLFLVDIPATLLSQEWYLRNIFHGIKTSFKPTADKVSFVENGINFINAFLVDTQDFACDVAINCDSMQEMDKKAVDQYLQFIEKNLVHGGFFYSQNEFGHSSAPVPEPSEYDLDANWTIAKAEMAYTLECSAGAEQARYIFERSSGKEDPASRRLVLRTLWNGFASGRIPNSAKIVASLAKIPAHYGIDEAAIEIENALRDCGAPVSHDQINAVKKELHFPHSAISKYFHSVDVKTFEAKGFNQRHMEAIWRTQTAVLAAMEKNAPSEVKSAIEKNLKLLNDTHHSEFWTAYAACLAMALGEKAWGRELLLKATSSAQNPWLIRFGYLLSRYGFNGDIAQTLARLDASQPLDFYLELKLSELEFSAGNTAAAHTRCLALETKTGSDQKKLSSLAKTAFRIGAVKTQATSAPHDLGAMTDAKKKHWTDYFKLAGLGRSFQEMGQNELADECLHRAAELRPGVFLHYEFIGNIYFAAARYDKALPYFEKASAKIPYLRHVQAKRLYSALPANARDSGAFGQPHDQPLIFQRQHNFYHDLGVANK